MKRALKLSVLLPVLLFAVTLAGCYDYSEPDEKAWVLALGLDKGKENVLTVTAVIAVPKNIAGGGGDGGGGGGGGFFTVALEAPTLLSSLELLDAIVDREADLSHTKWFVFSRELAEENIGHFYGPLSRFYQFRRNSQLVICEGRAEEFLTRGVPLLEDNVGKYYELIQRGWRYTEFIPADNFHDFYLKSKTQGVVAVTTLAALATKEPVYPDDSFKSKGEYQAGEIPRKGGGDIEVMGGAIINEGKMIGTLNGDEVGVQKMFFGDFRQTVVDVPDPRHPGRYVIVMVQPRDKPRVEVQILDGYPRITIEIYLEGEYMSVQSGEPYESQDGIREMEQAVEQKMLADVTATIAKSQELNADFLGLGLHAKKLFWTWPQWEAYNWDDKYALADISLNVDFKLRRIGLLREMVDLQ